MILNPKLSKSFIVSLLPRRTENDLRVRPSIQELTSVKLNIVKSARTIKTNGKSEILVSFRVNSVCLERGTSEIGDKKPFRTSNPNFLFFLKLIRIICVRNKELALSPSHLGKLSIRYFKACIFLKVLLQREYHPLALM